ncbi:MAG TPA: TIR domain-containing protein [Anaerolineales bacterium]|nr:TIR domain-containing protein [Anaerolineales bacterium]
METTENTSIRKNASVMISYSRKDVVFVRQLFEGLLAQGFVKEDIWVDWEGIPLTADWMAEITKGIQSTNAFVFVISPDSLASEVCAKEIAIAVESNKRFIPILYREPAKGTTLHAKISSHNWVYMRDEPEQEKNLPLLVKALNTDLDWLAQHTRLLNRALEWERKGKNDSYLVRGIDLQEAQSFMEQGAAGKEPSPTNLHVEYVQAARKYAAVVRRRNRIIAGVVGVVLFVAMVFALFQWGNALTQKEKADNNAGTAVANEHIAHTQEALAIDAQARAEKEARAANAQALAAEAFNQKDNDAQLALMLSLLSIQETEPDQTVLSESKSALFASLNSPNVLYTFPKSNGVVWSVAYDPNGVYVATGDESGQVLIWNVKDRELALEPIEFGASINGMDFSPDGTRLGIAVGDGKARVLDVESSETVFSLEGHEGPVNDIDFSADGKLIATAGADSTVKLWFADRGTLRVTLFDHKDSVNAVDFGPGGSNLLVSGSADDIAILWAVNTDGIDLLQILRPDGLNGNQPLRSVAFSPWGDRLLTGGYRTVVVWNIDGTEIHRLRGNQADVWAVAFSPDGLSMLTASSGVKIWDWLYGTERSNLSAHRGEVASAAYSSDGNYIVTGSWDLTSKLWSANLLIESLRLKQHNHQNYDANYSPDGKWIVTTGASGYILVHDAQTGEVVNQWIVGVNINAASFDPQGQRVVSGDENGQVLVWIPGQDEPALVINAHEGGVTSAAFSPDGNTILSTSYDGTAKVWDAQSGQELHIMDNDPRFEVYGARFSDDGSRVVTANQDKVARIWDSQSGTLLWELNGHTDYVQTAVFSHDGNFVYTGSYDNTIRKWNAKTGEPLQTLAGHTGKVNDLNVSPDNKLLASASADTTVKIWDLEAGKEIFNYLGNNEDSNSVTFSADGNRVLTASNDSTSKEFKINYDELLEVAQQYELRPLTVEECQSLLKRTDCSLHLFGQGDSTLAATPASAVTSVAAASISTATAIPTVPVQSTTTAEPAQMIVATSTLTAEVQAVPEAQSYYTEEFDGNLDSWSSVMSSGIESQVSMRINSGVLGVQLSPYEDKIPWAQLINNDFTYTDVQVEVVTTNNGNNANGVSLVCQYSDSGWYEFVVSNAQLYSIYAFDALGSVQPGYFEMVAGGSPAIKSGHVSNVYTAVCNGTELTLLVNGTPVKSITDTRYNFTEGKVGVGAASPQMLPVDIQFESVTVSAP